MPGVPQGHNRRRYWKGHYLRALPDEAIGALLLRGENFPNVSLQAYGGAIADDPGNVFHLNQNIRPSR